MPPRPRTRWTWYFPKFSTGLPMKFRRPPAVSRLARCILFPEVEGAKRFGEISGPAVREREAGHGGGRGPPRRKRFISWNGVLSSGVMLLAIGLDLVELSRVERSLGRW